MKKIFKKLLSLIAQNEYLWSVFSYTILPVAFFTKYMRDQYIQKATDDHTRNFIEREILSLSSELRVMHGPFRGMRYPGIKTLGSSISPKIIGCYERELHKTVKQICATDYAAIVDIGCDEGYYAVGLARRLPNAKIFAYDINKEAISFCEKMAVLNGVDERLCTGAFCDEITLKSIPFPDKAIIISDCEGYEKYLFTDKLIFSLRKHDFLVEVHDFIDIEISSVLLERFGKTHIIKRIKSIDDIEKAHRYHYSEIAKYNLDDRRKLFSENRPHIMEWFFMTPRPV